MEDGNMKKTYLHPTTIVVNVKVENLMQDPVSGFDPTPNNGGSGYQGDGSCALGRRKTVWDDDED